MPPLTRRRAIWVSALIAGALYLPAMRNDWALDDHGLIERNPAAHSIGAALDGAFSPYWPPSGDYTAGLYRPLATLSYALDWTASNGRPLGFHLTNALLHALATGLVVAVVLAWMAPAAALAVGLVFAVHPVHVEAVANIIGRAEVLVAIGLLAAVLAARRYRRAAEPRRRRVWLVATLAAVALALGSKEHGVVAVFVLMLDQALEPPALRRGGWSLHLGVAALTLAWLFLWRAIAGGAVAEGSAVPLRDLSTTARIGAVLPVALEALRLLVWPLRLAADYSPQTIPLRSGWSAPATVALVTSVALLVLAVLVRRVAPAVTFAILVAAATYLPTSNLIFVSGVVLAERALYLAVLAPAVVAGWALGAAWHSRHRGTVAASIGLVCLVFAWRTATRIPFWRDTRSVVVEGFLEHPENASNQLRVADGLVQLGDTGRALAHYLVASELYDGYPYVPVQAGRLALGLGRLRQALALGHHAYRITPGHPGTAQFLVDVFLALDQPDSALAAARDAVARSPGNLRAARAYPQTLERIRAPRWQAQLAAARLDWLEGRLVAATARIDSAATAPWDLAAPGACWDLGHARGMLTMLAPARAAAAQESSVKCQDTDNMMSQ